MTRDSSENRVRLPTKILRELGLLSLWKSSLDVKLLCAQRFVRLFAYGGSTLILASYLSSLGISDAHIGLFMTLTLVGDVVISFFLTLFADAMGRKAVLLLGSALMVGSGVIFALFDNFWILLAAAVLGVISPSGNEIGPFRAVEESTLAHLTPHESLGDIFAWYSLIGTAGTALGMMACGWAINLLQVNRGWQFIAACQMIFFAYAAIGALKFILAAILSHHVEAEKQKPARRQDQQGENGETQPLLGGRASGEQPPKKTNLFSFLGDRDLVALVVRLFILFALDSFASGLASLSWMTYFFKRKFSLPEGELGSIFFTTSIIAAASMLVASSIAKRIGNVKTMVFTHLPSAICLALIPVPNILPLALTFLVLRACSQNMDVAPRSAFLAAALPSDKRTAVMGAINVVKTSSQSLGPLITGVLSKYGLFGLSFTIAGILKAIYDIGMLLSFAGTEPVRRQRSGQDDESV
ncbi:major facilitator superfamily domain-containing protein [Aspergillus caelatus]|uniref:Major facilitator superfamily domain-containing protein n=2 Tax=Aspergillus subgen. Circumdati TaxID=2720871 RepID=A0A5N6ZZZ8_9EURO|nr:major facilitator superfamily domain-containing protein [Aspergillus caelatus]KAE8362496.1 major facilitator superfamily domain-containing protein [Aspergillus caelatus]KAE8416052.1 major facilitator superfamily domain-containing protein [Aspergillus pseudocaelatus]